MVDSSQVTFLPTSKSHDTKTRPNKSTYMIHFIEIEETFCGRTDVRVYIRPSVHMYLRMYIRMDGRTRRQ